MIIRLTQASAANSGFCVMAGEAAYQSTVLLFNFDSNPTRKTTPSILGKIIWMASEMLATEFSNPPIYPKSGNENRNKKSEG